MSADFGPEDGVQLGMPLYEVLLTRRAVVEIAHRIAPPDAYLGEPKDPFDAWEDQWRADESDDERDPLLDRLYPAIHPDDPRASDEFRSATEREQRLGRLNDAAIVDDEYERALRAALPPNFGDPDVHVEPTTVVVLQVAHDHRDSWLRALNTTRLALAHELGIVDEESAEALAEAEPDDDHATTILTYDLLGIVINAIVDLQ